MNCKFQQSQSSVAAAARNQDATNKNVCSKSKPHKDQLDTTNVQTCSLMRQKFEITKNIQTQSNV